VTGGLFLTAGIGGAVLLVRGAARGALLFACGLGVLAHGARAGGLLPKLEPLWLSARVEEALASARLLPRQGIAPSPVAVAGYAEPSLVFALGTPTDLGGVKEAADAIAEHRPAVVEDREGAAFRAALSARGLTARQVGEVRGLDYSNGDDMVLRLYAAPGPSVRQETKP
jgi:hypothetical protein